jgi:hypothetical protein
MKKVMAYLPLQVQIGNTSKGDNRGAEHALRLVVRYCKKPSDASAPPHHDGEAVRVKFCKELFMRIRASLRQLITHREDIVQHLTLCLLFHLREYLTQTEVNQLLHEPGKLALRPIFASHSMQRVRICMYQLFIWLYDNHPDVDTNILVDEKGAACDDASGDSGTTPKAWLRKSLLQGLSDPNAIVRDQIFKFWDEPSRSGEDPVQRMTHLLRELYDPMSESCWVNCASRLMLQLSERCADAGRKMFDSPLQDCVFKDFAVNCSWGSQMASAATAPLFSQKMRQQQGWHGSQDSQGVGGYYSQFTQREDSQGNLAVNTQTRDLSQRPGGRLRATQEGGSYMDGGGSQWTQTQMAGGPGAMVWESATQLSQPGDTTTTSSSREYGGSQYASAGGGEDMRMMPPPRRGGGMGGGGGGASRGVRTKTFWLANEGDAGSQSQGGSQSQSHRREENRLAKNKFGAIDVIRKKKKTAYEARQRQARQMKVVMYRQVCVR